MAAKWNDFWVQTYQNPFHQRVARIVDPLGKKRDAGALTYAEVQRAQELLENEIAQLEQDQDFYEQLGGKAKDTITGSRKTLDPIIAAWRKTFADDLATLTPPEDNTPEPPSEEAPTVDDVLPPGQTVLGQAAQAARQQRKRAMGKGRSSTFLGGSQQKPALQRRTLLGY